MSEIAHNKAKTSNMLYFIILGGLCNYIFADFKHVKYNNKISIEKQLIFQNIFQTAKQYSKL